MLVLSDPMCCVIEVVGWGCMRDHSPFETSTSVAWFMCCPMPPGAISHVTLLTRSGGFIHLPKRFNASRFSSIPRPGFVGTFR